jgi:hypothetical protein
MVLVMALKLILILMLMLTLSLVPIPTPIPTSIPNLKLLQIVPYNLGAFSRHNALVCGFEDLNSFFDGAR